ncbi:chemotaxis protein CheW [bacterium]|nr:chemotaxis protein CheW [bacterium]
MSRRSNPVERQFVVFALGREQFGFEITAVEGIVKMQEITHVPYAPVYVEGVTSLRGSVIPVIDLCKRFGLEHEEITSETRIIIVLLNEVKIGMVVSAVNEVLTIDDAIIEVPPPMVSNINSDFITGIAKLDSRLVILINLESILSHEEVQAVKKGVSSK